MALRDRIRQLEDMKLEKTEDMLLGKLIDFKAVWDYDSVEIRNDLYKLFFDWKELQKEMKPQKASQQPAANAANADDANAGEEGQSQAINADAE